jgi:flagellin
MALYVNTNVSALNGQRNLANVTNRLNTSFERLSSGSRINTAKDDAAGLQISDRLTTQITGLSQATRNANDGISIAQIAEGALAEVTTNVQRMRQLAVQGGNTVLSSTDRDALAQEFEKLLNVNESIAGRTAFGEQKLLDGTSPSKGFILQTGAYEDEVDTITTGNATLKGLLAKVSEDSPLASLDLNTLTSATVSNFGAIGAIVAAVAAATSAASFASARDDIFSGLGGSVTLAELQNYDSITINLSKVTDAIGGQASIWGGQMSVELESMMSTAGVALPGAAGTELTADQTTIMRRYATDKLLTALSGVVSGVGSIRAKLGAEQNGLMSTIRSNQTGIVNVSDSRSRIMDTDFAAETAELTRNQIIQQASNSILAQANQLPQAAIQLLG